MDTKFVLGEDAIPTHWVNLLPTSGVSRYRRCTRGPASPPARRTSRRCSRWR